MYWVGENIVIDKFIIVATDKYKEKVNTKPKVRGATLLVSSSSSSVANSTLDSYKSNRRSSICKKYTSIVKACLIEKFEYTCRDLTIVE